MSRHIMVTNFYCAECGERLNVHYTKDVAKPEWSSVEGDETGGSKVNCDISIEPCLKCLRPARDIMNAVKTLLKETEKVETNANR